MCVICGTGLGAIDKGNAQQTGEFYTGVGNFAALKGVIISVISITDQEASLENLGMCCDLSGGQVDRIDPLKLTENFANILEKPVLATGVRATLLLHSGLAFKGEIDAAQQQAGAASMERELLQRHAKTPAAPKAKSAAKPSPAPAPAAAAAAASANASAAPAPAPKPAPAAASESKGASAGAGDSKASAAPAAPMVTSRLSNDVGNAFEEYVLSSLDPSKGDVS
jgi:hypothetical protein